MNDPIQNAPAPTPSNRIRLTDAQLKSRRARSVAIAWAIGLFAALVFVVTLAKLGAGVLHRPM